MFPGYCANGKVELNTHLGCGTHIARMVGLMTHCDANSGVFVIPYLVGFGKP